MTREETKQKILAAIKPEVYNWPGTIAKQAGVSYSTANKYLKILIAEKKVKAVNIGIYSKHNVYKLAQK